MKDVQTYDFINELAYSEAAKQYIQKMFDEDERKALTRFFQDEAAVRAVRKALVGIVLENMGSDKRVTHSNWAVIDVLNMRERGMSDEEIMRQLELKIEAAKLIDAAFDKMFLLQENKKKKKKEQEDIG